MSFTSERDQDVLENVYYQSAGPDGATAVVFTHGFALDHETWKEQYASLSSWCRVVSWDLPGCGVSFSLTEPLRFEEASRCLLRVMDNVGVDRAVLVGQSMGSLLNQYVAHHHPGRVRALVHIGGYPLHDGFSRWAISLMELHVRILRLWPARLIYRVFGLLVARSPEARKYVRQASSRAGKENMLHLERGLIEDIRAGVPGFPDVPQLVAVGDSDISIIRNKSLEWAERLPSGAYVEVPHAGHISNQDNPESVNAALTSFLEQLE